jgi:hypothetical protein
MKKNSLLWIITGVMLVEFVGFSTYLIFQSSKHVQQSHELTVTQQKATNIQKELDALAKRKDEWTQKTQELEERVKTLESEKAKLLAAQQSPAPATAELASSANKTKSGKGLGSMIDRMMNDPEMKNMIRIQQEAMIKKQYASLFKDLHLTEAQIDQFTQMLVDNQMKNVDAGLSLINKDSKTSAADLKTSEKTFEDQLKTFLGDEKFAKYEDYKKTISTRMEVDEVKGLFATSQSPLQPAQEKQLFQIIQEENGNRASSGMMDNPSDPKAALSPDQISKMISAQQKSYQQIVNRASAFLSKEQSSALASFFETRVNMLEAGMKMASKMFTPDVSGTPPSK